MISERIIPCSINRLCFNSNTKYCMRLVLLYFLALFILAQVLMSCGTPAEALNLISPDRVGAGVSKGSTSVYGVGNKIIPNQQEPLEMDFDGNIYGAAVWLEWDLPQWKEEPKYDEYLRERMRTLQLEKLLLQKENEDEEPAQ